MCVAAPDVTFDTERDNAMFLGLQAAEAYMLVGTNIQHFPPLSPCNVIELYVMVARNTIYEFLIHIGLMIKPIPTENNMSRLDSRGLLICSAAI